MEISKIYIGSDHAGYGLKEVIKNHMQKKGYDVEDCGTHSEESTDYPDYAHPVANNVDGKENFGILICGSGNGISMSANKHDHIRCALCWTAEIAELARLHNDANILSMPARFIDENTAKNIVDTFFSTSFEGGRHQRRVDKIACQ